MRSNEPPIGDGGNRVGADDRDCGRPTIPAFRLPTSVSAPQPPAAYYSAQPAPHPYAAGQMPAAMPAPAYRPALNYAPVYVYGPPTGVPAAAASAPGTYANQAYPPGYSTPRVETVPANGGWPSPSASAPPVVYYADAAAPAPQYPVYAAAALPRYTNIQGARAPFWSSQPLPPSRSHRNRTPSHLRAMYPTPSRQLRRTTIPIPSRLRRLIRRRTHRCPGAELRSRLSGLRGLGRRCSLRGRRRCMARCGSYPILCTGLRAPGLVCRRVWPLYVARQREPLPVLVR